MRSLSRVAVLVMVSIGVGCIIVPHPAPDDVDDDAVAGFFETPRTRAEVEEWLGDEVHLAWDSDEALVYRWIETGGRTGFVTGCGVLVDVRHENDNLLVVRFDDEGMVAGYEILECAGCTYSADQIAQLSKGITPYELEYGESGY